MLENHYFDSERMQAKPRVDNAIPGQSTRVMMNNNLPWGL